MLSMIYIPFALYSLMTTSSIDSLSSSTVLIIKIGIIKHRVLIRNLENFDCQKVRLRPLGIQSTLIHSKPNDVILGRFDPQLIPFLHW